MKDSTRVFHWLPRIICMLAILFVSLFAADAFSSELTIWQQLGAFIIHLIPSFILLAIFIVAWKWEFIGGILMICSGLFAMYFFCFPWHSDEWFPFFLSLSIIFFGLLFIISWYLTRKASELS